MITRNVAGKGIGMKTATSAYIPTSLVESNFYISNIEEVLENLCSQSQDGKR